MTLFEKLLGHTLITADNIWGLMGVMCIGVALSIFLEQKYQWASKVSGAIIALIMAMVLANLGVIPTNSALYDDIVWGVIVPMAIPLLLLQCNLSRVWKDTGRMLIVFLIGAVGTIVGAFIAYYVLRGPFGDAQGLAKVASMMTGSYIGGGVNFAAMASQYAAGDDLTAAATVADNLLMAAYFFVLIACAGSKFFRKHFRHPHIEEVEAGASKEDAQTQAAAFWSRKDISRSLLSGFPASSPASSLASRATRSSTSSASSSAASTSGSPPSPSSLRPSATSRLKRCTALRKSAPTSFTCSCSSSAFRPTS